MNALDNAYRVEVYNRDGDDMRSLCGEFMSLYMAKQRYTRVCGICDQQMYSITLRHIASDDIIARREIAPGYR